MCQAHLSFHHWKQKEGMHAHSWDQGGGWDSIEHEGDETCFKLLKRKKITLFNSRMRSSKAMGDSL